LTGAYERRTVRRTSDPGHDLISRNMSVTEAMLVPSGENANWTEDSRAFSGGGTESRIGN
jgi:hypothetical protein